MQRHFRAVGASANACVRACLGWCSESPDGTTVRTPAPAPSNTAVHHRSRSSTAVLYRSRVSVRKSLSFPEEHPLYAVKASEVLGLGRMVHHETLRYAATGTLVEWEPAMDPLIFVSHQWSSFSEPDQERTQFELLVYMLRNLHLILDCSTRAESRSKHLHGHTRSLKELDWESAYVWLDLWSVPQERSALLEQRAAIRSIPAYVEQAAFLLVLAPPVQHRELEGMVDLASWGNRGWVRAPLSNPRRERTSECSSRSMLHSAVSSGSVFSSKTTASGSSPKCTLSRAATRSNSRGT